MIARFLRPILLILFLVVVPPFFYLLNYSQTISTNYGKEDSYELPHPGIAPDNPLYPVKELRDELLIFFSQDNITRAQYNLLLSDKKTKAGEFLVEERKYQLAGQTFLAAEKDYGEALKSIKSAIDLGDQANVEFVGKLTRSNAKHSLVMQTVKQKFPRTLQIELQAAQQLNHDNSVLLLGLQ